MPYYIVTGRTHVYETYYVEAIDASDAYEKCIHSGYLSCATADDFKPETISIISEELFNAVVPKEKMA